MARTLGKQNNNAPIVKSGLEAMNLAFCLGRSNSENVIVEGSSESINDSANNLTFAQRILPENILTVMQVPSSHSKYWVSGIAPHQYFSDGTSSGQFLFVQNGILFMIVGHPGTNNRTDTMGSQLSNSTLTRIDGGIGEIDGMQYMAINALPRAFDTLSSKYVEVTLFQNELNKLNASTSLSTQAKNVCGAGNELRTGNCCLYYNEAGHDPIAGVTHDVGDFYKCLCSKCYRCMEIAEALDMKYVFHKFLGGTGTTGGTGATGPGCLGCDAEDFPTDCGPCGCTIDWNQTSYYTSVIDNPNVSATSSAGRNAAILKYQADNLSGSILSANVDLKNLTWGQRTLASAYESRVKDGTLYLPLQAGAIKTEAVIEISTVYDSIKGRYVIDGIKSPKINGSGYTSAIIDEYTWGTYFPDWPSNDINNRFKINITPLGGVASNLERVIELSTLIDVVISSKNISDTFEMIEFDHYAIAVLKDENGSNVYSGHGKNQTDYKSLVTEFLVSCSVGSACFVEGSANNPKKKEYVVNHKTETVVGNKNIFTDTSINFIVPYDSTFINSDQLRVPIQTAYPSDIINQTINSFASLDDVGGGSKLHMDVDSISYRPESSSGTGHYYDPTKSEILHRNPVTINLDQNSANIKTFSFEILWGSQTPGISTA